MQSRLQFLKQWMRNPREMGSITPSSRFLTRELLGQIDFERARFVAELGPGTGVFTRPILEALHPEGKLLAIDTNPTFVEHLRREYPDPRLTVLEASAEQIDVLTREAGWPRVDAVISGIPYSLLPPPLIRSILDAARRSLGDHGLMVGYQYSKMLRPFLLDAFGNVHYRSVLLNLPPAVVYTCHVGGATH
ncbi:MAG: methyltransferase domain-containing protein [Chloroflexi bacterium]|nr:methyltransferase domain-containing protein [Chloroflexota bacterium]